jgi:hypothetical protein
MPKLLDNFMLMFPQCPVDAVKFISRVDICVFFLNFSGVHWYKIRKTRKLMI